VRRGDVASAIDYVDPPYVLSSEGSKGEVVWSMGRYYDREEIIEAFGKPTRPIGYPAGIHPCQPNPDRPLVKWMTQAALIGAAIWAVMSLLYLFNRDNVPVWTGTVGSEGIAVPVKIESDKFDSTVEVSGYAPGLDNSWVYLNCALINEASHQAHYVGLELSYYHGSSGGESWTEGSRSGSIVVGGITNGSYLLQITPEPSSKYKGAAELTVARDVPLYRYPLCTLFLLILVPAIVFVRSRVFEQRRWAESDHAG
jgi:hypothetical protein